MVMLDCAKILNDTSMTDSELGQKIKEAIVAGLAVPDELVTEAVVSRLAMPDCMSEGWILSGCPRTPAQAEAILNYAVKPDAYIMLEVDEAVATERLKLAGKVRSMAMNSIATNTNPTSRVRRVFEPKPGQNLDGADSNPAPGGTGRSRRSRSSRTLPGGHHRQPRSGPASADSSRQGRAQWQASHHRRGREGARALRIVVERTQNTRSGECAPPHGPRARPSNYLASSPEPRARTTMASMWFG